MIQIPYKAQSQIFFIETYTSVLFLQQLRSKTQLNKKLSILHMASDLDQKEIATGSQQQNLNEIFIAVKKGLQWLYEKSQQYKYYLIPFCCFSGFWFYHYIKVKKALRQEQQQQRIMNETNAKRKQIAQLEQALEKIQDPTAQTKKINRVFQQKSQQQQKEEARDRVFYQVIQNYLKTQENQR